MVRLHQPQYAGLQPGGLRMIGFSLRAAKKRPPAGGLFFVCLATLCDA